MLYSMFIQMIHLALAGVGGGKVVGPGLAALVVVTGAGVAARVGGPAGAQLGIVKSAVGTVRNTVLVQVVGVELLARSVAGLSGSNGRLLVLDVLVDGIVGADLRVVWAGEELGAHPVVTSVDGLARAVLRSSPWG